MFFTNQARSHRPLLSFRAEGDWQWEKKTLGKIVNKAGFRFTNNQLPELHSNAGFPLVQEGPSKEIFPLVQSDPLRKNQNVFKWINYFSGKNLFTKTGERENSQ